jgi:LysR family glycine cleavage system transcriptional activator
MRRLPPLGAIQAFVTSARLGSLKAAAESLALSAPALSRRIQALENFVGAPLFERQHNAVVLNPDGERFLVEVSPLYDALASAVERASSPEREIRLRVAVPSLFASQRLVPALPSLLSRHPNLRLELDTKFDRVARLNEGLDAAIVISDGVDASFYSKTVASGRVVALGSRAFRERNCEPGDPLRLAQFPALLHRDMPRAFEVWRDGIGLPGLEPPERIFFDSGQLVLDAAAQSLGVAYMLDTHLSSSTDERLIQLFDKSIASPYAYWFACSPNALTRPAVKAFHDWILDTFVDLTRSPGEAEMV